MTNALSPIRIIFPIIGNTGIVLRENGKDLSPSMYIAIYIGMEAYVQLLPVLIYLSSSQNV